MSSERQVSASAVRLKRVSKCYHIYDQPADRLKQMIWRGRRKFFREFWALHEVDLTIPRGQVLGVVGRNGAGKSTLLQLICGTLQPTAGQVALSGRLAALLELGAGFNPEFTGRENVHLAAAIQGLSRQESEERLPEIIAFSGVGDFIDQPVKTYSSGMYVRLAFSVATSISPDILVVDEALSVGDGEFARRSFDRIMALRDAGSTIIFCSHSLYQVEALCTRAIWLHGGRLQADGSPADVTRDYGAFLESGATVPGGDAAAATGGRSEGEARIARLVLDVDGQSVESGTLVSVRSRRSTLRVGVEAVVSAGLPPPGIGVAIKDIHGRVVASAGTVNDGFCLPLDASGRGEASLVLPELPLLKGDYRIDIFLTCERGIYAYEHIPAAFSLNVVQDDLEQGIVSLPHRWEAAPPPRC